MPVKQASPAVCGIASANGQLYHCEGKGATAMTDIPNDDKPGFVADKPEHCFACYRLIRT